MKIAQVSPLYESVPPKAYGGTERVVSYLTEELVRQGHDVTLFAAGDSVTSARLVAPCARSLRLDESCLDKYPYHVLMLEYLFREIESFDIVHFHIDYLHFPLCSRQRVPHLTTLHGRLDIPDLHPLFKEFRDVPVVSISNAQRAPLPWVNWQGTVYHGLPQDLYRFRQGPGKYLAFLGRIHPEKRVDRAIEIAQRVGIPLRIAAKVDAAEKEYFHEVIEPLLKNPLVEFIGEIGEADKQDFLGNAMALLFLIDWPEPFGLAMIEALACGTPVIAYGHGSVPEVIQDGVTGFIVHDQQEAESAIGRVPALRRADCRRAFEERFSVSRMTEDYVAIYRKLLERNAPQNTPALIA